MRIGILGGTFDPVHEGHLRVAEAARAQARLDNVLLAPAGDPPHRHATASAEDRLAMTRLAVAGHDGLCASDVDALPGARYAVDTVRRVARMYPGAEIYYIIGEDKLPGLAGWREAETLFSLCEFLCYPRWEAQTAPEGARVTRLHSAHMDVSSGMARAELERLSDAPGMLPASVARHIALRELYRAPVLPEVKKALSEKRYLHTLGVRETAVTLAQAFGASLQRAALTGALHDIARETPYPKMRETALALGVTDAETLSSGALLHGPLAAEIAKERFHVTDESVLEAIAAHTTGAPGMDVLALCVFVADAIEPGRENYPGLTELRAMAARDLTAAAIRSLELTRDYLSGIGGRFALASMNTLEYLYKEVAR